MSREVSVAAGVKGGGKVRGCLGWASSAMVWWMLGEAGVISARATQLPLVLPRNTQQNGHTLNLQYSKLGHHIDN